MPQAHISLFSYLQLIINTLKPNFKRYLGVISILFAVYNATAQKPEWIRISEVISNGSGQTYPKSLTVHPDGSVFIIGQYGGKNTLGGQPLNSFPNNIDDAFIAKYTASGDLLWMKQMFQSKDWYANRVIDIKVDHNGDLVFSGCCFTISGVLGSTTTGQGPFIAKADKEGNLLWLHFESSFSAFDADVSRRGNRIGFDSSNNILWFTDQSDGYLLTGGLGVVKYKPDGTRIFNAFLTDHPSFYHPYMQDFAVHPDGSFTISGSFEFTISFLGGPSLHNYGNYNPAQFFLARYSASGKFLWVIYSDDGGTNVITSHTADADGNVYVSWQVSGGTAIYTSSGVYNTPLSQRALAKITSDGKLDWVKPLSSSNVENIFFAPDGLLYVTGAAFGKEFRYQSYVREMPTSEDAFILKINKEGNFHGFYLGVSEDDPSSMWGASAQGLQSIVDTNGNIYTIGYFNQRLSWGCIPVIGNDYSSFFLVKHSATASPLHTISGPGLVCDGTEITLTTDLVSNGVLYKWFTPDNADPGTGAVLKNSITLTAINSYNKQPVIVSIKDNCDEYFTEPFILNVPKPPPTPQLSAWKDLVCPGTSEIYKIGNKESGAVYNWTLPQDITAPSLTDEGGTFTFNSNFLEGEVKIKGTNFCGSSEQTFKIGTFKTPAPPVLSGNQTLCPGSVEIQKSVTAVPDAVSYQWELPSHISFSPFYSKDQVTLRAVVDADFQMGEIKVRAVGQCKTSDASLPVVIKRAAGPGVAESLTGPGEICTDLTFVRYTVPPVDNAVKYTWKIPGMFDLKGTMVTTTPYINLKVMTAGSGALSVYGSNDCQVNGTPASIPVITYAPLPIPKLTITECNNEIAVSNAEDFQWYVNGVKAPDLSGKNLVLSDSGIYHVEVANFCGVQSSNKIQAYPALASRIVIPNVITPNGDNKNDFFTIDKSLPNPSVHIINRWGGVVYSSPNYKNEWNGADLAPGTYFLTMQHHCLPYSYKGWISIIK